MNETEHIEEQLNNEPAITNAVDKQPKESFWTKFVDWWKYDSLGFFIGLLIFAVVAIVIWFISLLIGIGVRELVQLMGGTPEQQLRLFQSYRIIANILIWIAVIYKFILKQPGRLGMWDD